MKLSVIAFRNISRNRRRSILSGIAICIATMVIVLMFSLIGGMKVDISSNVLRYASGHIRIRHEDYDRYENLNPLHLGVANHSDVQSIIEDNDSVKLALSRIRFFSAIYREENNYRGMGLGIDFFRELSLAKKPLRGDEATSREAYDELDQHQKLEKFASAWGLLSFEGELPAQGKKELLLATGLAEELKVGIGDKLTFYTKTAFLGMQAWTFRVKGIVAFPVYGMNQGVFLAPLDSVQRFLKMDAAADSVTEILVHLTDPGRLDDSTAEVRGALKAGGFDNLDIKPWTQVGIGYSWMKMAEQAYNIMALMFFLLASTVIINTTMMVIFERMKEIGTISAMGMTGREITILFFLEALFISLMAALAGVILGIAIVIPLSIYGLDLSEAMGGIDMDISGIIYPVLSLRSTVFVFFYSVTIASLASFIPTRKAARIEPVEALRST